MKSDAVPCNMYQQHANYWANKRDEHRSAGNHGAARYCEQERHTWQESADVEYRACGKREG